MARYREPTPAEIQENKKRRNKRRVILVVIMFVMVAAVTAELLILRGMTSVDRLFIRNVERSVAAGWKEGSGEFELRKKGQITDVSFIETELETVEEFRGKPYNDEDLGNLAKRYIDDLYKCSEAAKAHDSKTDNDEFWQEFAAPYTDRLIVLRTLYNGDYGLGRIWDDHPKQLEETLFRGWLAESAANLRFERSPAENGSDVFRAKLKNDTGHDIEFVDFEVELYNSKDKAVGTAEVYRKGIKKDSTAELRFYFKSDGVASYRIVSADGMIASS